MWIGNTNCNMKKTWFMAMPFLMLGLFSCQKENQTKEPQMEMLGQPINETYVDTMVLRMQPFNKQIVCNGRLRAKAKSELSFLQQGVTMQICVTEGQYVAKGTLIASLDKTERLRELEKAEHELERARVELTDKLIGLGYDATLEGVPEDVMKRAEVLGLLTRMNHALCVAGTHGKTTTSTMLAHLLYIRIFLLKFINYIFVFLF